MSRLAPLRLLATFSLVTVSGCAHTVVVSQSLAEMDRAREAPAVRDGASLAPQEFQHAEDLRKEADSAHHVGDDASADLLAERSRVAYERAVMLARLARATAAGEAARLALAKQAEEAQRLAAARVPFEQAADATAAELAVAREALAPTHIGPADASRERARLLAARSLAAEGQLLCGAARLLSVPPGPPPPAPASAPSMDAAATARVDAASRGLTAVMVSLSGHAASRGATELDAAAKARAACLDALTRERRTLGDASVGDADALLAAVSAHGGWDPSRDERGVVVTLRGAFHGTALAADAERQLRELGRVAASHADWPLQVVVHDATPPSDADRAADLARAKAALAAMGTPPKAAAVEAMGALLPTADPSDPQTRARNARLEVVFISRTD